MFDLSRFSRLFPAAIVIAALPACGGSTQTAQPSEGPLLAKGEIAKAPNGIAFPAKYKNWPVLALRQRDDQKTISVVVGNLEATRAVRQRQTNPWPDGSIIGHLVFEQVQGQGVAGALASGDFVRAEFMFKDLELYANNRTGWGWARWQGEELAPYGKQGFEDDCIECHTEASGNDWLFSKPVALP